MLGMVIINRMAAIPSIADQLITLHINATSVEWWDTFMRDCPAQSQATGPTLPADRASMPKSTPVQTVVPPAKGLNVTPASQQLYPAAQSWTHGAKQSTN